MLSVEVSVLAVALSVFKQGTNRIWHLVGMNSVVPLKSNSQPSSQLEASCLSLSDLLGERFFFYLFT